MRYELILLSVFILIPVYSYIVFCYLKNRIQLEITIFKGMLDSFIEGFSKQNVKRSDEMKKDLEFMIISKIRDKMQSIKPQEEEKEVNLTRTQKSK